MSDVADFVYPHRMFVPRFIDTNDGMIARGIPTDSGWPGARLRHDTRCTVCGELFAKGDEVVAQLAIPIESGTWRHKRCAESEVPAKIGPTFPATNESIDTWKQYWDGR